MAELTVDLTYGGALFGAAMEAGKAEIIMEEATEVLGILKKEPYLYAFINYPVISVSEKKAVISNIFKGRISDELLNFMYVLIDKRRTMHFEQMIKVYKKLMDKETGLLYGTVYSVEPLSQPNIKELEEDISKLFRADVRLVNDIDPKLMGGIKILVDGKMIDASFRTKFDRIGSQIRNNQGGKR